MGYYKNISTGPKTQKPFEIYGTEETIRMFQRMYDMGARTHNFRSAFNRAAKPMIRAARTNAKRDANRTGNLWKSIKLLTSKRYKGVFWIGPTRRRSAKFKGYHGWWLEHGTKDRKGGTGRISGKGYMRKAYTQHYAKTRHLIEGELWKELYKLIGNKFS